MAALDLRSVGWLRKCAGPLDRPGGTRCTTTRASMLAQRLSVCPFTLPDRTTLLTCYCLAGACYYFWLRLPGRARSFSDAQIAHHQFSEYATNFDLRVCKQLWPSGNHSASPRRRLPAVAHTSRSYPMTGRLICQAKFAKCSTVSALGGAQSQPCRGGCLATAWVMFALIELNFF